MIKIRSWIGLNKVSNEWHWADGTKASYTNWIHWIPFGDGSSVEIVKSWNLNADHKVGYVCQYAPNGKLLLRMKFEV